MFTKIVELASGCFTTPGAPQKQPFVDVKTNEIITSFSNLIQPPEMKILLLKTDNFI